MIDTLILPALGISDYFFASLPATFKVNDLLSHAAPVDEMLRWLLELVPPPFQGLVLMATYGGLVLHDTDEQAPELGLQDMKLGFQWKYLNGTGL